ncbi:hypothetical protein U1Q18_014736 [Sarracenia purpurea var. burkii]
MPKLILIHDCNIMKELLVVSTAAVSDVATVETLALDLSKRPRQQSYQRYPCLTLTVSSARREQWILQRLQEEIFIIRAELRSELETLDKDKQTMMDRRMLVFLLSLTVATTVLQRWFCSHLFLYPLNYWVKFMRN